MELVYLWVEKYKNIEKQGFNFSPRFSCEYDKDSNKLKITENNDYVNIFPENINITAIVGENGSGKSSIIKLILFLIFTKFYDKNTSYNIGRLVYDLRNFPDKEIFLILNTETGLRKIVFSDFIRSLKETEFKDETTTRSMTFSSLKPEIIPEIEELKKDDLNFYSIYFNYMLDTIGDKNEFWTNEIYHKSDDYQTPLLTEPLKYNEFYQIREINIDDLEYLLNQKTLKLFKELEENKKLTIFFNPNKIRIVQKTDYFERFQKKEFKLINKIIRKLAKITGYPSESNQKDVDFLQGLEEKNNFQDINYLYLALKVIFIAKLHKGVIEDSLVQNLQKAINQEPFIEKIIDLIKNSTPFEKPPLSNYKTEKIIRSIDFHKEKIFDNQEFKDFIKYGSIDISKIDKEKINIFIPPWLDFEFYEDEKSLDKLSGGEKAIFRTLTNIGYQLSNLNKKDKYKSINLFLDELEIGLHPNWQKEYISNIIFTIEQLTKKQVNIFTLTHSPFILSDLPKQNVIFLKDGKQVDGVDMKQTFGANIHTLLSDGFFTNDGLMGEFAKSKIRRIQVAHKFITYKNNKKLINNGKYEKSKDIIKKDISNFWQIQGIIGEPYLQAIVKNWIEEIERILFGKSEAIDLEIKRLQKLKANL